MAQIQWTEIATKFTVTEEEKELLVSKGEWDVYKNPDMMGKVEVY